SQWELFNVLDGLDWYHIFIQTIQFQKNSVRRCQKMSEYVRTSTLAKTALLKSKGEVKPLALAGRAVHAGQDSRDGCQATRFVVYLDVLFSVVGLGYTIIVWN
ncbi:hypothetical protein GGU11DRAFT_761609, partial [Lentinula aff. detonsa]